MTQMSRSRLRTAARMTSTPASWVWPAVCMLLGQACFYVKPIKEPVVNLPPTIDFPTGTQTRINVTQDVVSLAVYARDVDSSRVFINWPGLEQQTFTSTDQILFGEVHVGSISMERPAEWGVSSALAHITDDSGNLVTVDFDLVFP